MKFCPHCMSPADGAEYAFCPNCGGDLRYTGAENHLPVGTVLNGSGGLRSYLVGASRGQGGFGITYIALEQGSQKRVAVKEFFPSRCAYRGGDKTSVQVMTGQDDIFHNGMNSFLDEAKMLAAHDNLPTVVRVIDYFQANNTAYLVMEYVDGVPLHEQMRQMGGRLPASKLISMLPPLLRDLDQLHRSGVIHRDISPDNLMWMPDGSLKLLDFGCARSMEGDKSMTVLLKHGFAPIEQYRTRGQGPYTDVYALAATVYYCITGQTPPSAMDRLDHDTVQSPIALGADLTVQQETALLWALSVKPEARPQTMQEFAGMLFKQVPPPPPPNPNPGTTGQFYSTEAVGQTGRGLGSTVQGQSTTAGGQFSGQYGSTVFGTGGNQGKPPSPKKPTLIAAAAGALVLCLVVGLVIHFATTPDPQPSPRPGSSRRVDDPDPTRTPRATPTPEPTPEILRDSEGYLYSILDGSHAVLTGYEGADAIYSMPDDVDGVPITAIADGALAGANTYSTILLPVSLETIGANAFRGCSSLQGICCYSSVTTDRTSFSGCHNLRVVRVPEYGSMAGWTGLPTGCRLFQVGTDIGVGTLDDVELGSSGEIYGITTDGNAVLLDVPSGLTELEIPDTMDGYPVTWVHSGALDNAGYGMNITLGKDACYDYSLQNSATWYAYSGTLSEAWIFTCTLADGINSTRASLGAPEIVPTVPAAKAAMTRATELTQVYDANRPDGSKWSTAYTDEAGDDWRFMNGARGRYNSLYGDDGLYQGAADYVKEQYAPAITAESSDTHAGEYRNKIGGAFAYNGTQYCWYAFVVLG